ncbi:MAG TPA: septal ring lytic transglycosylase RlpA family protein [Gammaproteobacteria bacterium]|nr:septal ring lytic transglycosylase RlpA family protein [Gammaproteobacteria bacterium]
MLRTGVWVIATGLFTGCATKPQRLDGGPAPGAVDLSGVSDAVPKEEPRSKYGNPASYVVLGKRYYVMRSGEGYKERGIASWYGDKFHGRRTSSGEPYDMYAMTAAHKSLPLPTYVSVTNLRNGKNIVVRVNDRGPFHENRIIDLSYAAASRLDILRGGTGLVEVSAINPADYKPDMQPPTPAPGARPVTGFYIQVGAFADLGNARRLSARLAGLDRSLHISQAVVNGRTLYRVRLGPLLDTEAADILVAALFRRGVSEYRITID